MSPPEHPAPTIPHFESENLPKTPGEVYDDLVRLDTDEAIWRQKSTYYREKAELGLHDIAEELESMREKHGDDPAFADVLAMYDDLKSDYDSEKALNLDSSLAKFTERALRQISEAGIEAVSPKEVNDDKLSNDIKALEDLGLQIEYAVPSGLQNAPTIVLLPQLHFNPGMSRELMAVSGVSQNQQLIEKTIKDLAAHSLSRTVFVEGVAAGREVNEDEAAKNLHQGATRAKLELAGKVDVLGFDDQEFLRKALVEIGAPITAMLRATANNITLASNLAREVRARTPSLSTLVIGALHEVALGETSTNHPFPLSNVIAYEGMNVVVVNSPQWNKGGMDQWLRENPSGSQDIADIVKEKVKGR